LKQEKGGFSYDNKGTKTGGEGPGEGPEKKHQEWSTGKTHQGKKEKKWQAPMKGKGKTDYDIRDSEKEDQRGNRQEKTVEGALLEHPFAATGERISLV